MTDDYIARRLDDIMRDIYARAKEEGPSLLNPTPRDHTRISAFMYHLWESWCCTPDQRFGQIVLNIYRTSGIKTDLFNVEDDVMLDAIKKWGQR